MFLINRGGKSGVMDADLNVQKCDGSVRDGAGEFKGELERFEALR